MEKQKIVLTTILVMFVLAVLPVVSAATMDPQIYAPLNSTNHTGTVTINCTTEHEVTNVSVWYGIGSTAMVQLGSNLANSTVNDNVTTTVWNGTLTITAAMDGTYNVSCKADNTSVVWSPNATGIMFDTTDPVCSLVRQSRTIEWKGTQLITWTSTDTNLVSTLVTIDRPEDGIDLTDSDANDARTLTSQETKYVGDWTVTLLATDGATNTCTEEVTFKSTYGDGEIWEAGEPPVDTGKNLLLLIIIGVVLWYIFIRKK